MMSSMVARFRVAMRQSQIVVLDMSTIIKTYKGIPIPNNWNTMEKSAGNKEAHLLLFKVIRWWSRIEWTISSRLTNYKITLNIENRAGP